MEASRFFRVRNLTHPQRLCPSHTLLTLCIIASTNEQELHCIQVKTPGKKANVNVPFIKEFVADDIDNLLDNLPETENRCHKPGILSYRNTFAHEKVKGLISNYDYSGAVQIARIYTSAFSETIHSILRHLDKRSKWNLKGADREIS